MAFAVNVVYRLRGVSYGKQANRLLSTGASNIGAFIEFSGYYGDACRDDIIVKWTVFFCFENKYTFC